MNIFLLNVVLAIGWAVINGSLTARDVGVGFALGYLLLWLVSPALGYSAYFERLWKLPRYLIWYLREVVRANVRVAVDVLTPKSLGRPGILAIPLDCETDAEITAVANLVSLTPGTLSLALSKDRRTLYVHIMGLDAGRLDDFRRDVKEGIERRVLELARGKTEARKLLEDKT